MRVRLLNVFILSFVFIFFICVSSASSLEKVDYGKILGDWEMEVETGGGNYYLSFTIEKKDGNLTGTISESSGLFTDAPLSNIEFNGQSLSFEMSVPIEPDGEDYLIKTELELSVDKLEGILTIEELGMSASAVATKKK